MKIWSKKSNYRLTTSSNTEANNPTLTQTAKQNRLIEMRGPTGPKQSHETQTVLTACKDKKCHLGFNVICRSTNGACFLSKSGSGREHTDHPQYNKLLYSTINMDDATRKLIQSCSRVSATVNTIAVAPTVVQAPPLQVYFTPAVYSCRSAFCHFVV
jgi:hypothetical protein